MTNVFILRSGVIVAALTGLEDQIRVSGSVSGEELH